VITVLTNSPQFNLAFLVRRENIIDAINAINSEDIIFIGGNAKCAVI